MAKMRFCRLCDRNVQGGKQGFIKHLTVKHYDLSEKEKLEILKAESVLSKVKQETENGKVVGQTQKEGTDMEDTELLKKMKDLEDENKNLKEKTKQLEADKLELAKPNPQEVKPQAGMKTTITMENKEDGKTIVLEGIISKIF